MHKKTEALKLAEDALKRVRTQDMELVQLSMIALAAIREALAEQPAQQQNGPINEGWQITVAHGHSGHGVYAHMEDYPEEGAVLVQAIEQPAQQRVEELLDIFKDVDQCGPLLGMGQPAQQGCMRCNTPKKCALYGCSPLTWPAEQPAQQEPVAWLEILRNNKTATDEVIGAFLRGHAEHLTRETFVLSTPAAPQPAQQQEPWVGLTDAEIRDWWRIENGLEDCNMAKLNDFTLAVRAVELKLREKNT